MSSLKRRMVNQLENLLDSHIIKKGSAAYWPEQFFVARMFARLKPDCVFDVGANIGQYARGLRAQGFKGTILSFEPNPDAYEQLTAAAAGDADWHCYPMALGRAPGVATFNVMKENVFSSFRTPLDTADTAEFAAENSISRTVDVRVERLETMLPKLAAEFGFRNPFLKMDTQGFDLEVFRGGGAAVHRFCALLSEVPVRKLYADSPDMHESLATFNDGGFDTAALYSVHARIPLKTIEFNCYCVRHDLADVDVPD